MEDRPPTSQGERRRRWIIFSLNAVLAVTGAVAVATLLVEYGFRTPPLPIELLHGVQAAVMTIFVLDWLVRLLIAPQRLAYVRKAWIDLGLALAAIGGITISYLMRESFQGILSAGALYVVIAQGYILVSLILRAVTVNMLISESGIHPLWLLIGSFAFLCLAGSGLLMLPAATVDSHGREFYLNALFTSVSATCVTGLTVVDIGRTFTPFGQAVILGLIQLGGLGIILFGTTMAILVGKGLSLRGSSALGQMMSDERIGLLGRTATFVVLSTLVMETIGAILLYPMFAAIQGEPGAQTSTAKAVWDSIFHSISAFCNAGLSLYPGNMMQGVKEHWTRPMRDYWQVIGVMPPLIVLGGLGFPVLQNCAGYVWTRCRRAVHRLRGGGPDETIPRRPRLALHTKLVLCTTVLLIFGGAVGLLLVDPPTGERKAGSFGGEYKVGDVRRTEDWPRMPTQDRIREALFQSVSARTAGFSTIDCAELSNAGKMWMCGLMIVGGSPGGTAGGMKTVTFALLLITVWCVLRQRDEVEVFHRSIPSDLLHRNFTLAVLYLALVGVVTLVLCAAMPSFKFIDLMFEACSACGTVGLSTGITSSLNDVGKWDLLAGMFIGRVGPLTLVFAFASKLRRIEYSYPSENVVIG